MTILLFYTRNQGYLSQFFEELSILLVKAGYSVYNYSLKSRSYELNENGVQLTVKKRGGYFRTYRQVFDIIKAVKPDIVISNFSYVNPALLFGRLLGVKKNIAWFDSLKEQTGASYLNILIKRNFLKLSDLIIANSQLTKTELIQDFNVKSSKVQALAFWSSIHNETSLLRNEKPPRQVLKIGTPGRLVTHKNQRIVLDALSHFEAQPFEFHIAGTGPEKLGLEQLTKTLNLNGQVVFRGHLSAEEMLLFYQDMDVVVLPSLAEAFGLVFIEAIALGTPVVVSSAFGSLSFITDKTELEGFTFDPQSKADLIAQLKPYFDGHGLPSSYFKTMYHTNFDKELIYKQFLELLHT
ncbi:glycosyltransferase family 4 protein [Bizionia sp. KMM 8389]